MRQHFDHWSTEPKDYEARRGGHLQRRRVEVIVSGLRSSERQLGAVMELGCGTGSILSDVAAGCLDVEFWGLDVEPKFIEYAQEHHQAANVTWLVGDATAGLPCPLDGVYSIDVLHHVAQPAELFHNVRSALGEGGRWVVVEPNVFHPYISWQQESMRRSGLDEDHFRPWKMLPLLRQAGFALRSRSYAHLFPATIKQVGPSLGRIERVAERLPVLGGSVVLILAPA